jgi:hypothetical protein
MTTELTEEEMRQALFGSEQAPAPVPPPPVQQQAPEVVIAAPPQPVKRKKASTPFTPRLKVTLHVGNVYEGDMEVFIHEADTLSTLLAEQEAMKAARKKFRYIELVSVERL